MDDRDIDLQQTIIISKEEFMRRAAQAIGELDAPTVVTLAMAVFTANLTHALFDKAPAEATNDAEH